MKEILQKKNVEFVIQHIKKGILNHKLPNSDLVERLLEFTTLSGKNIEEGISGDPTVPE